MSCSRDNCRKISAFVLLLLALGMLIACGGQQDIEGREPETSQNFSAEEQSADAEEGDTDESSADERGTDESLPSESAAVQNIQTDEMKEKFGQDCISDQTFEIELSECSGKVYFVPFAPSDDNPDFHMQIIQDGEVLTQIHSYVPDELKGETFSSLDAVSFYDVNFDDQTDIVLIVTYGDTSFAAIYYGAVENYYFSGDEVRFYSQSELSDNVSDQMETLTLPEIRTYLTGGKKNGEFADYREAYRTVSRLHDLESAGREEYDLIYFDEDEIPELVTGVEGYYVSLYTYHDGKVYILMDSWGYGAMGNAGYEYSPHKNSLRNYNADFAGLIMYTTYMTIGSQYSMDMVVQIETLNFDDADGDGYPDESEINNDDYYSVSYIDGVEITDEQYASYDVGEYEYITPAMSLEDLYTELK